MIEIPKRYVDKCLQKTREFFELYETDRRKASDCLDDRNVYSKVACEDVPLDKKFAVHEAIRDFTYATAISKKPNEVLYKVLELFDIKLIGE